MHSTQAIRLSHTDDQRVGNRLLSGSSAVIVVVVVLVAIVFFWKNPFRVGEITVFAPNGPSVTVKVANSNDISELIQKGLENETTAGYVTNSLLDIIEKLPVGSTLGDKLMELARGREFGAFDRSIDVQISRLRRLVETDPSKPAYIQTVWGFGYVFIPDGERREQ